MVKGAQIAVVCVLDASGVRIPSAPPLSKPWKSETAGPWQSLVYCAGFIIRVNVLAHVPRVQIPPDPPICYHRSMKVEKQKFDAVLGKLLKAKPVPRTSIKATGKRNPRPILAK